MKRLCMLGLIVMGLVARPAFAGDTAPIVGTVEETMEGGRYTYLRVTSGESSQWVAASHMEVAVGDEVTVSGGTLMTNFKSPTLDRTFDEILFAETVEVGSGGAPSATKLPPGHPPLTGRSDYDGGDDQPAGGELSGEVLETMDAGGYTYVQVRTAEETLWAASSPVEVKAGDRVSFAGGLVMKNFESPTLKRTFDQIHFVDAIHVEGREPATHGSPSAGPAVAAGEPVAQPEGAKSVTQIFAQRKELEGQVVTVKGRVTKFTAHIMDRNWIHLADGTGQAGDNDLTVTSDDKAAVGDIVTVKGTITIDQDFGYGYAYPVIVEKATLTRE